MRLSPSAGVLARLKIVKRTPSNRASPPHVPSQMYPSRVCTIARTEFCGRPSRVSQTSWPYWVMSLEASRPCAAGGRSASTIPSRTPGIRSAGRGEALIPDSVSAPGPGAGCRRGGESIELF